MLHLWFNISREYDYCFHLCNNFVSRWEKFFIFSGTSCLPFLRISYCLLLTLLWRLFVKMTWHFISLSHLLWIAKKCTTKSNIILNWKKELELEIALSKKICLLKIEIFKLHNMFYKQKSFRSYTVFFCFYVVFWTVQFIML